MKRLAASMAATFLLAAGLPADAVAQGSSASAPARPYLVRGYTADGHASFAGRVSISDRLTMHAEQRKYSLWVARPSGAHLADVRLKITDLDSGPHVLERTLEGPWFMMWLSPGPYEVQGSCRDEGMAGEQTMKQTATVSVGIVRQAVLRFDATADVAPEMRSPFGGNPFAVTPRID